ncbi:MAG: AI-2E family transporter [Patescibacteria group bacterium]
MSEKDQDAVTISIKSTTFIKGVLVLIGVFILMNVLQQITHPLIIIFVAFFLAIGLNPSVNWITKRLKSHSRIKATGIAYAAVMTVLVGFFSLVVPPLVGQTVVFIQDVPETISDFKTQNSSASQFVHRYNLDKSLDNFSSDFSSHFSDISKPALATATTIGSTIGGTIAVLVLTFMMLVEGPRWLEKFWDIQPVSKRKKRKDLVIKMYKVVTGYVNGQVLVAALGGFFTFIALVIMSQVFDVSVNAIALAGIITLFALLPLIGTTIGAVLVVVACIFISVPLAIAMTIYFIVYQQIENVTIQPYIQSRSNNLTPLLVFMSALIGVSIGGIMGALFAIPVAGCVGILIEDHYHDRLEKAKTK